MAFRSLKLGGAIALSWRDFTPMAVRVHDEKTLDSCLLKLTPTVIFVVATGVALGEES